MNETELRCLCIPSPLIKTTEQYAGVIDRLEAYYRQKEILGLFGVEIDNSAKQYKCASGTRGFTDTPMYYSLWSDVVEFRRQL